MDETSGYSHTQHGPLCLIYYGLGLACFALAWLGTWPDLLGTIIVVSAGLLILFVAPAYHHLTVSDEGDRLAIRFGPLPLRRKTLWYDDMERVETGRIPLLHRPGIHNSLIRGGWVWSLWGRDCVVVHLRNGRSHLIDTDDAENLARFLEGRIAPQASTDLERLGGQA